MDSTNLSIVSGSGGTNVLTADLCGQMNLDLVKFGEPTIEKLTQIAPTYASVSNPVDLTADIFSDRDLHINSIKAVLEDKNVNIVIVPVYANYGNVTEVICQDLVELPSIEGKLIIPIWMSPMEVGGLKRLEEGGLIPFRSVKNTIVTVKRYVDYCKFVYGHKEVFDHTETEYRELFHHVDRVLHKTSKDAIDEYTSKNILNAAGISVTNEQIVQTSEEAVAVAEEIGYPVALKIVSSDIPHKTEAGIVRLDIRSDNELRKACDEIKQAATTYNPHAKIEGVLVSEMVQDGIEMILGLKLDPQYGSVVLIGLGGIYTEILKDVVIGMNPISKEYAFKLISKLKGAELLNGFRGGEKYDVEALASTVEKLSRFGAILDKNIGELDINPLLVLPEGKGVKALDALII